MSRPQKHRIGISAVLVVAVLGISLAGIRSWAQVHEGESDPPAETPPPPPPPAQNVMSLSYVDFNIPEWNLSNTDTLQLERTPAGELVAVSFLNGDGTIAARMTAAEMASNPSLASLSAGFDPPTAQANPQSFAVHSTRTFSQVIASAHGSQITVNGTIRN